MSSKKRSDEFEQLLDIASVQLRPVCSALRKLITTLDPDRSEIVWLKLKIASFGVGPKKMTQHYAYIAVQRSHINLGFYHGTSLPDPDHLLEGAGKALRHVKIRDLVATKSKALRSLLSAAIAERTPYANED